jgi:lipoprotein-anchoring transpeptidase ErfK/SrfK
VRKTRLLPLILFALSPFMATACSGSDTTANPPPTTAVEVTTPASTDTDDLVKVATASKDGTIQVYDAPDEAKKAATTLKNPRMLNGDPKALSPLVMVVNEEQGDWLNVSLPVKPNGSKGWVKASDFTTDTHSYRIEVGLGAYNLKVFKGKDKIFDFPIAVATDDTPTPGGDYYITELQEPPNPNGVYGPYAFGLSGFSEAKLPDGFGDGQLGIHGTNEPQFIGKKVSHGCIRLKNEDITQLARVLPLGTPVEINA